MWEAVPIDPDHPEIDHGPPPVDPGDMRFDDPGSIGEILSRLDEPGGFAPEVDRDGDLRSDTAQLDWADGIALATDVDGDGRPDTVTTIDRHGAWQVYQRSDQPGLPWRAGRSGQLE